MRYWGAPETNIKNRSGQLGFRPESRIQLFFCTMTMTRYSFTVSYRGVPAVLSERTVLLYFLDLNISTLSIMEEVSSRSECSKFTDQRIAHS